MECDDQAAGLTVRTILRHEQPASAVHAIVFGIAAAGERVLIELALRTAASSGVLGVQAPVESGQKSLLGIYAAVVDIRNVETVARIRAVGGDPAVGGLGILV